MLVRWTGHQNPLIGLVILSFAIMGNSALGDVSASFLLSQGSSGGVCFTICWAYPPARNVRIMARREKDRVIGNSRFGSCNNSYGRDAAGNVAPS